MFILMVYIDIVYQWHTELCNQWEKVDLVNRLHSVVNVNNDIGRVCLQCSTSPTVPILLDIQDSATLLDVWQFFSNSQVSLWFCPHKQNLTPKTNGLEKSAPKEDSNSDNQIKTQDIVPWLHPLKFQMHRQPK